MKNYILITISIWICKKECTKEEDEKRYLVHGTVLKQTPSTKVAAKDENLHSFSSLPSHCLDNSKFKMKVQTGKKDSTELITQMVQLFHAISSTFSYVCLYKDLKNLNSDMYCREAPKS